MSHKQPIDDLLAAAAAFSQGGVPVPAQSTSNTTISSPPALSAAALPEGQATTRNRGSDPGIQTSTTNTSRSMSAVDAERAIFELEELKVRLDVARNRSMALACQGATRTSCLENTRITHVTRPSSDLEASQQDVERRVCEMEKLLQVAALHRNELQNATNLLDTGRVCETGLNFEQLPALLRLKRALEQPSPPPCAPKRDEHSPWDVLPSSPKQNCTITSRGGKASVVSYFCEKLDECIDDRRQFFERYLRVRDAVLEQRNCGRQMRNNNLQPPHQCLSVEAGRTSPRASSCGVTLNRSMGGDSGLLSRPNQLTPLRCRSVGPPRTTCEIVLEQEERWCERDQAVLEARVRRAEGRHRELFNEVARLERDAKCLEDECSASRAFDGLRVAALQALVARFLALQDGRCSRPGH